LAASHVATLSPAEIAGLLDERFRLLTGGRRTAVERHRTLRATVDWSYSLLSPTEQHLFDRLGVFAGSFDTAAAVAVAGGDNLDDWAARQALAGLVHKSMVNRVAADTPASRYQMLETLRAYARARLDERGEADQARHRHARHYALRAEQQIQGRQSQVQAGGGSGGQRRPAARAHRGIQPDTASPASRWPGPGCRLVRRRHSPGRGASGSAPFDPPVMVG
jgi:predicted ATPase